MYVCLYGTQARLHLYCLRNGAKFERTSLSTGVDRPACLIIEDKPTWLYLRFRACAIHVISTKTYAVLIATPAVYGIGTDDTVYYSSQYQIGSGGGGLHKRNVAET